MATGDPKAHAPKSWWALTILVVLALCWSTSTFSAAVLRGAVVLDRERGAPAAGVQVAAQGANPVTTGNDGLFVLSFPEQHAGQDVRVLVKRAGWEVVNDILLDHRLPDSAGNSRPLEIIICLSAERELRVAEFYRLKGNQSVEQTYKAKLAELEGRQAATAQERDRLLRERDQALKQVEEWARQSAARKPEEVGGTYRDALRLFLEGKADAALQLLSDERLQQEAQEANEKLKQAIQGWLLKGQLLSSRFDYDAAGRAYEQAVKAAPASTEAWFAYAYFHLQQKGLTQARRGYEQAPILARQSSDEADVAMTLNNLGVLSRLQNRNDEARKQYGEALDLYQSLAKKNPDLYRPRVVMTLNNLIMLSSDEHGNDEMRKLYGEALEIYRSLAEKNPDDYLVLVAVTLNNLGSLNRAENRNDEASKQYGEALDLYRSLAKKTPDVYLPYVATTLNDLGPLSRAENQNDKARKQYDEALEINRSLAKKNPDVYLPDVADTLNNLGTLSSAENRNDDARKQYGEALAIYAEFAARQPAAYGPRVKIIEHNIRNLPK